MLPEPGRLLAREFYYVTSFHELHSTGHSSRLDRGRDRDLAPFKFPDHSREELVAEMGSAPLCATAGRLLIERQGTTSGTAQFVTLTYSDYDLAGNAQTLAIKNGAKSAAAT